MDLSSPTHYTPSLESYPPRSRRQLSDGSSPSDHESKRRRIRVRDSTSVLEEQADSDLPGPIDLTELDESSAIAEALAKQREDAVKAQQAMDHDTGRSALLSYKCPVCMDTPEDATTTVCGHLFCHKCIIDTLKFSENNRADTSGKTPRGTCPVCRKPLARSDGPGPKRNLVPLQLKLTTRKRNGAAADNT